MSMKRVCASCGSEVPTDASATICERCFARLHDQLHETSNGRAPGLRELIRLGHLHNFRRFFFRGAA